MLLRQTNKSLARGRRHSPLLEVSGPRSAGVGRLGPSASACRCRAPLVHRLPSPSLLPAAAAAGAASGPSGSGSLAPGPAGGSDNHHNHNHHHHQPAAVGGGGGPSAASAVGGGGGSSSKSYSRGQVRGTVLRTVDPVVAAASAARALSAPPAAAAAASGAESSSFLSTDRESGTYDSVDVSMDDGNGGGVRLLVVVGVVLLDDPEWTDAAAAAAAAEAGGDDGASETTTATTIASDNGPSPSPSSSAPIVPVTSVAPVTSDRPVRVLLAQRLVGKANAGLWEFPGGKVDPGETPEAALVRELWEELGIAVETPDLTPLTFASHTYPTFHLLMPLYVCRRWRGEPRGAEGQAVAWATAGEVSSYNLTPADIPLVPAVLAAMRHGDT
ncbi:hypothetical protein PLESTF_000243100 [Pleodorina starrii]|nr:hypothetical protein PLESTM_001377600 [Pleodorina starrii]GLC65067.1 hypothetical protein PLESTF_000243100 [Pleodorina starrii]